MKRKIDKRSKITILISLILAATACLLTSYFTDESGVYFENPLLGLIESLLSVFWVIPFFVLLMCRVQDDSLESLIGSTLVFAQVFLLSYLVLTMFTKQFFHHDESTHDNTDNTDGDAQ